MRYDDKPKVINRFPSKATRDANGNYKHDPDNQLLAEQEKRGLTGAQPKAQTK